MKKAVLALFLPLLALNAQAQEANEPQFLVSSSGNVLLLAPKQHIIDGQILSLAASSNGRFVHVFRFKVNTAQYADLVKSAGQTMPTLVHTLIDTTTKRAVDLKIDPMEEHIVQQNITPQGTFVCKVQAGGKSSVRVYGMNGGSATLTENVTEGAINSKYPVVATELAVDPSTGQIILMETEYTINKGEYPTAGPSVLTVYNHQGQVQNRWNFAPRKARLSPGYRSAPRPVVLTEESELVPDSTGKNLVQYTFPDPDPSQDRVSALEFRGSGDNDPSLTRLIYGPDIVYAEGEEPDQSKDVEQPRSVVIGANLAHTVVGENVVLLADTGGLHKIDLIPFDLAAYRNLLAEKARQQAMSRAKQVAVGFLIYSSDYDDRLPTGDDWQEKLNPYMKNNRMMDGFNYLLNGELMSDINKPAETVLGIITTAYGEAIAYADGHVIWRSNTDKGSLLLSLFADPKRTPQLSK